MSGERQSSTLAPESETARHRVQDAAIAVGVTFLVVGVLGFIPGVTTHYKGTGGMGFSGLNSHAELFGLFRVSVLHNGLHMLLGLVGVLSAMKAESARLYLIAGGLIYLVLSIYGFVIDNASSANFVPINTADNWLHLVLAVGMVVLGVVLGRVHRPDRADA
jgi:Domain of unknown function (DUF4383)